MLTLFYKIWGEDTTHTVYTTVPGNGSTLDVPRRDGEVDRGLLVGDLDLVLRGFGRSKELKSRFSNKLLSLCRTRKGFL